MLVHSNLIFVVKEYYNLLISNGTFAALQHGVACALGVKVNYTKFLVK